MAITADSYTDQGTKIVNQDYEMLRPDEHYGRRRVHFMSYVAPAGNEAIGNHVFAAKIPAGARILGGKLATSGMGALSEVNVGLAGFDGSGFIDAAGTVADDDNFLGDGISVASAGEADFAESIQYNFGYKTDKAVWIVLTPVTAAWIDGGILKGDIEIVVD